MNTYPINQTKLFGLNTKFAEIIKLIDNNNLPSKMLLSGPKGNGKATFAYHIINYIFSKDEKNKYNLNINEINKENRSFKLIQNNTHPNFYLIDLVDDKKNIEISQIRKMINYTNKSSFNDSPKFILIDNIEYLNKNSSNALLKIIEEPNLNVFFILIHNSDKKILNTLKSRCLTYKIDLNFDETLQITNKLLNDDIYNLINIDLINYYNSPGNYLNLINFAINNNINLKELDLKNFLDILIKDNHYKKNNFIKANIFNFIELYFLKILIKNKNKNFIIKNYTDMIYKNSNTSLFNLDYESLFMEFRSKILNG